MGCTKLTYQKNHFLEIVHSKKRVRKEIKRVNYYPFGLKHKGYNNVVNGTDHPYGFGGKEEQNEFNGTLGWHDFGARNYDASLGRWMNIDPLADKYRDFTPYNYTANNPILYIDPDGREIIISGNTRDALTKLAQIAATSRGEIRINQLKNSPHRYTMESVFWTSNSSYDSGKRKISYPSSVWRFGINGGAPNSEYVTGHEIDHAYRHDTNTYGHTRKDRETSAVNFGNYMRSVYGEDDMRTSYFGLGLEFSDNENVYNNKKEKITNFEQIDDLSTGGDTILAFSYEKSEGGEDSETKYMLSSRLATGEYLNVTFDSKEAYDKRLQEIEDYKNKEEDEKN